jgi:hypothetical protein
MWLREDQQGRLMPACLLGLVLLAWLGGPVLGGAVLVAQLAIMGCIVHRSSATCRDARLRTPWANVARPDEGDRAG